MIIMRGKKVWRNSRGAQRFVGFFSCGLFLDADWLGRETPIAGILEQSWERVKTANEMTQAIRTSSRRLNFLFPFLL